MDFIFISMPYARFISRWFSHVPNINLGTVHALLTAQGRRVKTFHFHLQFLPYLEQSDNETWERFVEQSEKFGIEYMGMDYVFASLFFEQKYMQSQKQFAERLETIGLSLNDFEDMRNIARSFIDAAYAQLTPYLSGCKLVGFSSSHYQLSSSLLLCTRIKKQYPATSTIFGGKDCSGGFAKELMEHCEMIDFVGISECESTVCNVLDFIDGKAKQPSNVLYRDNSGSIVQAPEKPAYSLETLPFPQFEFGTFPLPYHEIIVPIEFGRGCPWKRCSFCPDESYNIKCQVKTARRLKAEIDHYQDISTDLNTFFILDSDALKDPKTILDLSRYLYGKGFTFQYAEFRAERMSREVLTALLNFGKWASNFQIGIETFSDRLLDLMNKGVHVLKNVEVLKAVAELHVPIQFNLFTCFPKMTADDMFENLRVMDMISHILVQENIQIYPGEFYLPTDCPVFLNSRQYGIIKHPESIFSLIFENLEIPSFSNYPYPYEFDNDEEQFKLSHLLRNKVDEIKSVKPQDNAMRLTALTDEHAVICVSRKGQNFTYNLDSQEKEIYMLAMEKIQSIDNAAHVLNLPVNDIAVVVKNLEDKGLILTAPDKKAYLSLALRDERAC
jgi:hypothetical protein